MSDFSGNDNGGKPKQLYLDGLVAMSDDALLAECSIKIWLSSFAANNLRSDYHWHVDALYAECERRGKLEIYRKGYYEAFPEMEPE